MNKIRRSFLSLDLFSLMFKNITLALLWGAIAPMICHCFNLVFIAAMHIQVNDIV